MDNLACLTSLLHADGNEAPSGDGYPPLTRHHRDGGPASPGILARYEFGDDERHVAEAVLESLILKHQARQAVMRTQSTANTQRPTRERRRA